MDTKDDRMNTKGGMNAMIGALVGLFAAVLTLYVVMVVWQPITTLHLYPLLENAEAFTHGGVAVTLLQAIVLVIVAAILLAFFNEARGPDRPPEASYGYSY